MGGAKDYDVRRLTEPELAAAWELTRLAFGAEREPPPGWLAPRPGREPWGMFDDSGRLVAKATDREQAHWFGGRLVPATGIAGVVVVPELRGTGLAGRVLTPMWAAARNRGAVLATLFRTTPTPYRRLGCEDVGALSWTTVPTAALAGLRRPAAITLRAAELAEVPAVLEIYRTVARAEAGLMERSGPLFDTSAEAVLAGHDGLTVAVGPDGAIEGYASWDRGPGYDAAARLSVPDLFGLTGDATTALLAMLGSWAPVAPALALRLPEPDPAGWLAHLAGARTESTDRWMLRVLDARGAVAARGWPAHVRGEVELLLDDGVCPWNAGPHRLVLTDGSAILESGGAGAVRMSARGLAVLYAGAAGPALLRRAGLLSGGTAADDAFLQAATTGPAPRLLDYF
jgi:predicted acetyltransferase